MKTLAAAFLLAVAGAAGAQQPQIGVPPTLEVQRLAPQLVQFYGANYANLVNALFAGTPVTLTSADATGLTQTSTFAPRSTLTSLQIAQTLEAARQSLISNGVAAPTAQQVAVSLVGGNLQTATGLVPTAGVLAATTTATTPATAATTSAAAGATSNTSPAGLIQQQGTPATTTVPSNTSNSPFARGISDTPPQQTLVTPGSGATTTTTINGPSGTANAPAAARFRAR